MNQKQKRALIIVAVVLVLALLAVGIWLAVRSGNDVEHQHSPILVEAKKATCTEDGNNAYYRCECGKFFTDEACKNETTEAEQIIPAKGHNAVDDGDCDTALVCSVCNAVVREAGVHLPEKDDGNCKTEVKCQNCGEVAIAASSDHKDTDHDYICDNGDCQITVEGAPKDDNEGIDLPIDKN